jgi:hypothetical protein
MSPHRRCECTAGLFAWAAVLADGEAVCLPGLTRAFQCVAIGPLVKGLAHLDPTRLQRELRFMSSVAAEVVPQAVSLAAIWSLVRWLRAYRALLFATLLQAGLCVLCTPVGGASFHRSGLNGDNGVGNVPTPPQTAEQLSPNGGRLRRITVEHLAEAIAYRPLDRGVRSGRSTSHGASDGGRSRFTRGRSWMHHVDNRFNIPERHPGGRGSWQ